MEEKEKRRVCQVKEKTVSWGKGLGRGEGGEGELEGLQKDKREERVGEGVGERRRGNK